MKKGFTLLEIMLTLLFLGTVLLSILHIFGLNIRQTSHLMLKRQAIDLASSRLEVETYNGPLLAVTHNFFQIKIIESRPLLGINRIVTVNVSWPEANDTGSVTLSRTFYKGIDE